MMLMTNDYGSSRGGKWPASNGSDWGSAGNGLAGA